MIGFISSLTRLAISVSLVLLSVLGMVLLSPGAAQAANFGSLTDNGTAAYMGIGITPAVRPLHLFGNVALFQRGQDSAGFIIQRTDTNRWVLGVNEAEHLGRGFVLSTYPVGDSSSTPRLLVSQTGNVGIGTVYPSNKLHVETYSAAAVYGRHNTSSNYGYIGSSSYGVYGDGYGGSDGVHGASDNGSGVCGHGRGALGKGVYGSSSSNDGVYGWSNSGHGVRGSSTSSAGVGGDSDSGVGVYGNCGTGIGGYVNGAGVYGQGTGYGVYGASTDGRGIYGYSYNSIGVYGESDNSSSYAGYFDGSVKVAGSFTTAYRAVSGNYTADAGDSIIAVSAPAGDVTVSLPSAAGIAGRSYTIKRTDAPGYAVTIQAAGTETIDVSATQGLGARWAFKTVVSDGSNWLIVGEKL